MKLTLEEYETYKGRLGILQEAYDEFVKRAMNAGSQHTYLMEQLYRFLDELKPDDEPKPPEGGQAEA